MNFNREQTMVVSTVRQYINRFNNVDTDLCQKSLSRKTGSYLLFINGVTSGCKPLERLCIIAGNVEPVAVSAKMNRNHDI